MPSATLIHAACFALGAAVGGGAVAAASLSRKREVLVPSVSAGTERAPAEPVVVFGKGGQLDVARTTENLAVAGGVLKYGNPGPISDLLVRRAYVTAYDRRLRHPAWTAEHITLSSLGRSVLQTASADDEKGDRSRSVFTEDPAIPLPFRARLQDYFRSGYDRGHMVPAADAKFSQDAMDETFLLTNIAPQVGVDFNRHYWAYVEEWCRRLTGSFQDVFVFTIPLYLPKQETDGKWRVTHEVIGSPPNISVPTHFAKVVLTSKPSSPSTPNVSEISTGAFVLPNAAIPDTTPFESFSVPIEAVERAAGLTLFSEQVKTTSKHICESTRCDVLVRRFDDAQKQIRPPNKRAISAPN